MANQTFYDFLIENKKIDINSAKNIQTRFGEEEIEDLFDEYVNHNVDDPTFDYGMISGLTAVVKKIDNKGNAALISGVVAGMGEMNGKLYPTISFPNDVPFPELAHVGIGDTNIGTGIYKSMIEIQSDSHVGRLLRPDKKQEFIDMIMELPDDYNGISEFLSHVEIDEIDNPSMISMVKGYDTLLKYLKEKASKL